MAGKLLIVGYQIGFRICNKDHSVDAQWARCDCAYTDLPMHRTADYVYPSVAKEAAQELLDSMRVVFWAGEAEWRIQECWD